MQLACSGALRRQIAAESVGERTQRGVPKPAAVGRGGAGLRGSLLGSDVGLKQLQKQTFFIRAEVVLAELEPINQAGCDGEVVGSRHDQPSQLGCLLLALALLGQHAMTLTIGGLQSLTGCGVFDPQLVRAALDLLDRVSGHPDAAAHQAPAVQLGCVAISVGLLHLTLTRPHTAGREPAPP